LDKLLPQKMIPVMIEYTKIDPEKPINAITKAERECLLKACKEFTLTFRKLRDYNEAIVTKGGVSVKDIDPGTMESKRIKNLYFAGEVLDLDAVTGGFNLQIAWSTGWVAGVNQ